METSTEIATTALHRPVVELTPMYSDVEVVPDSDTGITPKRRKATTENVAALNEIRRKNNEDEGRSRTNGSHQSARTGEDSTVADGDVLNSSSTEEVVNTNNIVAVSCGMNGSSQDIETRENEVQVNGIETNGSSHVTETGENEVQVNSIETNGSSHVTETGENEVQVNSIETNCSSHVTETGENEAQVNDIATNCSLQVDTEVVQDDDRPVKSGIINGWFSEWIEFSCGGHAVYLKIDEVLFHEQSPYQDILVFKSSTYGMVLVLDGIINCTERDEFSYQEMMAHLALCSHPNPQSVLIIGGGDGGVAREVAKHDVVKRIVQCEIDAMVVDACKKFIPSMAKGFDDERVELIIGDGFAFIDEHVNEFDVIITDSSDPEGPAETLFGTEYYSRMCQALKPNGLLLSQGQTMWIQKEVDAITPLLKQLRQIFAVVNYAYTFIPTYTMGQIGFILASKNPETKFNEPLRVMSEEQMSKMNLRYYNPDVHRASFVMPQFIRKILPV